MIALLESAGIVVLVLVSVFLARRQESFFEARLEAQDATEEERRVALYKQQKATSKAVAQSDRAVRKLADETRHLKDETELALRRTDAFFADPRVKRALGKEGEEVGR